MLLAARHPGRSVRCSGNGKFALGEIDAAPASLGKRQIVDRSACILGIVGMVFLVLSLLWVIFIGGLAALSGSSST